MLWPSRGDYAQAVGGYPHRSILDSKLKIGNPRRDSDNYLMVYSGGFSTVFPIEISSHTYALRCWIVDIGEAETRYKKISEHLKQCRLSYFVDFEYVPEGILVNGDKLPIIRMEWADGDTLCDFINQNLHDAGCLKTAAAEFKTMVETLHNHQISHGDLQDGNILLKRNGADVEFKLIDYDSVFVPALSGQPDNIVGVPAYQHPQRIAGGRGANEKVDYFSELVIYLSLLSLSEKPDLWSQFGAPTEKRLLFIAEDFKNPDQSDVFRELEILSPEIKHLSSKLKEFCNLSVDQLEPLEAVLPRTSLAQAAYDQAIAHLRNKSYNEAKVEFEKAIGLDPNYKEAHHGLGLAHLRMSDFAAAKKAAEAALRIDIHYQPALDLMETVKLKQAAFNPVPTPPKPPPSNPPPPPTPTPQPSPPWKYICIGLASVLVICVLVLASSISEKDKAMHQNQKLQKQVTKTGGELTSLRAENQALENKNTDLQTQLDDAKKPNPKLATLEADNARLLREKRRLQYENKNLKVQLRKRSDTGTSQNDKISVEQGPVYTGTRPQILAGHTKGVFSVAFSPNELTVASGSWDSTIRLWDAVTGAHQRTLTGHTGAVYSIAFSPDGQLLVSGSDDKTVRLWDTLTGAHRRTLTGHTDWVYCVAFSPDGLTLASGSDDHTIRLWDVATGVPQRTLTGHTGPVRSVAFIADGATLASGSFDKSVRLWDAVTGEHRRTLTDHTDWVYSVAFSPDGGTLASGSWDRTIRFWGSCHGGTSEDTYWSYGSGLLRSIQPGWPDIC